MKEKKSQSETNDWIVAAQGLSLIAIIMSTGSSYTTPLIGLFSVVVSGYLVNRLTVVRERNAQRDKNIGHLRYLMFMVSNANNKIQSYKKSAMKKYNSVTPNESYLDIHLEYGPLHGIDPVTAGSFDYLFDYEDDGIKGERVAQLYYQFVGDFEALKLYIDQYNQTKITAAEYLQTQGLGFNTEEIYEFAEDLDHALRSKLVGTASVLNDAVNNIISLCSLLEKEISSFAKNKWSIHLERSSPDTE